MKIVFKKSIALLITGFIPYRGTASESRSRDKIKIR